ncbi:MAG: hypothetical protein Q9212_005855 [Teloschistes hypoglaucus]
MIDRKEPHLEELLLLDSLRLGGSMVRIYFSPPSGQIVEIKQGGNRLNNNVFEEVRSIAPNVETD